MRLLAILLVAIGLCTGTATAEPLSARIVAALRAAPEAADLPIGAEIQLMQMTPVRGDVRQIAIDRFDPRTGHFVANLSNGGATKSVSGRATVAVPAVVTTQTVPRGTLITPTHVRIDRVVLAQLPADPIMDEAEAIGTEAVRSLPAGRPVTRAALSAPAVVQRNDRVTLRYEQAHLRLTAEGTALENGAPGSMIRVMATGGAIVTGRIAGPGLVSVE
jgi:flagella basal body P-ring formation protein FlgA